MDDIDFKIIGAINTVSPKSFVSPVKVNEVLKLDANQLGTVHPCSQTLLSITL